MATRSSQAKSGGYPWTVWPSTTLLPLLLELDLQSLPLPRGLLGGARRRATGDCRGGPGTFRGRCIALLAPLPGVEKFSRSSSITRIRRLLRMGRDFECRIFFAASVAATRGVKLGNNVGTAGHFFS
jgi:hypothetical protein